MWTSERAGKQAAVNESSTQGHRSTSIASATRRASIPETRNMPANMLQTLFQPASNSRVCDGPSDAPLWSCRMLRADRHLLHPHHSYANRIHTTSRKRCMRPTRTANCIIDGWLKEGVSSLLSVFTQPSRAPATGAGVASTTDMPLVLAQPAFLYCGRIAKRFPRKKMTFAQVLWRVGIDMTPGP